MSELGRRILIVDDSENIHQDFKKVLAPSAETSALDAMGAMLFEEEKKEEMTFGPYLLDHAYQGEEAVLMIDNSLREKNPYSLAFIDMRMPPGIDGLETIRRIWNKDTELQIIICSAYSDYTHSDIAKVVGETDRLLILRKPFDPLEVIQLVKSLSQKWVLARASRARDELLKQLQNENSELKKELQKKS